jgi:peptidoglycan-associated lipoprotein
MADGGERDTARGGAMKSSILAIQTAFLVIVAAGCAKTPAMTTASAPAPTAGAVTVSNPPGGRMSASEGTRGSKGREDTKGFQATSNLQDIGFDFDRYEIRPDAAKALDADAQWLNGNRNQLVLIEGHCDERGTVEYNLALGERRAKATQNYLAAHGVASSRISIVSYGKEKPQCTEHNEACWARNRRAHFLVKPQ